MVAAGVKVKKIAKALTKPSLVPDSASLLPHISLTSLNLARSKVLEALFWTEEFLPYFRPAYWTKWLGVHQMLVRWSLPIHMPLGKKTLNCSKACQTTCLLLYTKVSKLIRGGRQISPLSEKALAWTDSKLKLLLNPTESLWDEVE